MAALFASASLAQSPHFDNGTEGSRANCAAPLHADICEAKRGPPVKRNPGDAQRQRALLDAAVGRLAPQRPGTVDLYTIAVAGWAGENVFIRELEGAIAVMSKLLPVEGRILRLVNHRLTMRTTPLATRSNLSAALHAVSGLMDRNEDVLVLFMTSHGNQTGFGLRLPRRAPLELPAPELARMLDAAGVRHRVVIVSACYSGIFVKPLANDDTIVMTAADADNPSFGCAPGREWTYFGDALFNRSLRPGVDLPRAFTNARILISEWELKEKLNPSNPQAHFGPALTARLAPFFMTKPAAD